MQCVLVRLPSHELQRVPGSDRGGGDHPTGASLGGPPDCRTHRRSGRKPVIDEQYRPSGERGLEASAPKSAVQRTSLGLRPGDSGRELVVRQAVSSPNVRLRSWSDCAPRAYSG